jgi:hypothetical protein
MQTYHRRLLSLNDEELEIFVADWVAQKAKIYHDWIRYPGTGDLGRDVVGFHSAARHEGRWDNYQCKQLSTPLGTASGLQEIGKILYYASLGNFTPPTRYYFVAPKGINRNLQRLIDKPSEFKAKLLEDWDQYCAESISEGQCIQLEGALLECIRAFDFSTVYRITADELLRDPHVHPVLVKWFGADPGPPPGGTVPVDVELSELPYVTQLLNAYGQRDGSTYEGYSEIVHHPVHGKHFARQRVRFYDAAAYKAFYRDNTESAVLERLENEIYHGVVDTWEAEHIDPLHCVEAVMSQAANVSLSGPLAIHTQVPVKQGVCHHFANEDRIRWCP